MKKVKCEACQKKCVGNALKANNKFYHVECFTCQTCKRQLNELGFFVYENNFFCPDDYHSKFGRVCAACQKFVDGEVVDCLGKTFHQACFKCSRCCQLFASSQKITETGHGEFLCQKCVAVAATAKTLSGDLTRPISPPILSSPAACAACDEIIHSGQVLLALDTQWHIFCFKCKTCDSVLHGEYVAKDGVPYCLRDYNAQFGVMCYECAEYISGKVLQAGDYFFHPDCALCSRCGEHFEGKEELYMQGNEIWHARCNELKPLERITKTIVRSPKRGIAYPKYTVDFGKHLTYMYLLPEQNVVSLNQTIAPHPPLTPQYHFPQGNFVKIRKSRISMFKTSLQKLAEVLTDQQQPRPKSPHMDNEEPIELSQYPGAHQPDPTLLPPIERDDFPAPPYPYAVEELRRRLSQSDIEEEEDVTDAISKEQKIKKAGDELKKYENESSIAKIVASTLEDSNKKVKAPLHWDPRSASRVPSAKKLPVFKCRYESPVNASPSRYVNRPRPWECWDKDRSATATIPYFAVAKPGYNVAQKSATLPGRTYNYDISEFTNGSLGRGASAVPFDRSTETLPSSFSQYDATTPVALKNASAVQAGIRRSLPDMTKTPKIYPYEDLLSTNETFPDDVDRCHLERHLNKDDFDQLFGMTPIEFYKLPEWKRINLKRKAKLY